MRFRVTPLEIVLCIDSMLVSLPLLLLAFEKVRPSVEANAPWALRGATVLALGFLALRSRSHKTDPRPPSSNPARRVGGAVLMGVGGTLALLGFVMAYAMCLDFKRVSDGVWLAIPALPILLGNVGIYAGAAFRAPPGSRNEATLPR